MKIEQNIQAIPELKIGDGKELKKFEVKVKYKNLKDWFVGFIFRW